MTFGAGPLKALVDPLGGVARTVEARRWLWPVAVLALSWSASGAAFALRWNAAPVVLQEMEPGGSTTEQDIANQVQQAERVALVGALAKGVLGAPLGVLLLAIAVKALAWLLSRPAPFARCFSTAAVALLPVALFHIVFALVAWRTPELSLEQAATLVPSSLAALVHKGPKWTRVLGAVDYFNLWSVGLWGLGFSATTGMRRWRSVLLGLGLYAGYAAVVLVALPGLTGGSK
jgi:hypothetical protein